MDVTIPSVGESVTEGTIGRWFVKSGDYVNKDDPLFELDSDKASMEVTAETSGQLKIIVDAGKTAEVGSKVGEIDESASGEKKSPEKKSRAPSKGNGKSSTRAASNLDDAQEEISKVVNTSAQQSTTSQEGLDDLTPSQRRAVRSGKASKSQIKGSGLNDLQNLSSQEVRKPMTQIRKRIAQRLMESQQNSATLTTFNEVDMSHLLKLRGNLKEKFQKKHGIKLGFMSFFSKAVLYAMDEYRILNAHIEGDEMVEVKGVHLSMAVSTDRGLVVPVIRNAQGLGFAGLEKAIADLADKARDGKLQISEMQGGTFTLTNGGVFGSLLSTPILNPPQSGILGMHKTEYRPIALQAKDGTWAMEVRPMMYLALSYDHRLIDGKTSVGFLVKVKEYIEDVVTEDDVMA